MTEEMEKEEAREEAAAGTGTEAEPGEEKPVDKMTAKELREIAKDIPGVSGVHAMKKDELLAVVKEARGIKDEVPEKKRKAKTAKKTRTVKDIKMKVLQLKEEREQAGKAKDRNKLEILRRRINRMKKLTRKVAQA